MKPKKHLFSDKPPAEKKAIAADFDQENIFDRAQPLSDEQWEEFTRWRSKLQRKKSATRRISMTIDTRLVARADAAAKKLQMDRGELFACGLERFLELIDRVDR